MTVSWSVHGASPDCPNIAQLISSYSKINIGLPVMLKQETVEAMDPFTRCTLSTSCEMPRIKPQGKAKLRYLYRSTLSGMLGCSLDSFDSPHRAELC